MIDDNQIGGRDGGAESCDAECEIITVHLGTMWEAMEFGVQRRIEVEWIQDERLGEECEPMTRMTTKVRRSELLSIAQKWSSLRYMVYNVISFS